MVAGRSKVSHVCGCRTVKGESCLWLQDGQRWVIFVVAGRSKVSHVCGCRTVKCESCCMLVTRSQNTSTRTIKSLSGKHVIIFLIQ